MFFALASLIMLGSSMPSQLQLPSHCTGPSSECIRATQMPTRWTASSFSINYNLYPDPPIPPAPYNYGNWGAELDMIGKRLDDAYIYHCSSGNCSIQYLGFGDWRVLPFELGNGFIQRVDGRPYLYVAVPQAATCGPQQQPPCGWQGNEFSPVVCPAGWTGGGLDPIIGYYCYRTKKADCPKQCTSAGNPIDVFLKNKVQVEIDWSSGLLRIERGYRSDGFHDAPGDGAIVHPLGPFWRLNYERRVVEALGAGTTLAQVSRETGRIYTFVEGAGGYTGDPDSPGTLTRLFSGATAIGWTYESVAGEIETYDTNGVLQAIATRDGRSITLTYDANGYLIGVADERGRTLQYGYDTRYRLTSVTLPDGSAITYEYNPTSAGIEIWKAHLLGGATRTYNYDSPNSYGPLLTSIVDENGATYANFTYDSNGYPLSTSHTGGVDTFQVVTNQTAAYIDPLLTQHKFTVQTVANASRVTGETKTCTGCTTLNKTIHYDSVGNVDYVIDFNGNKTTYAYDPVRFLETSRTEAATDTSSPPATRTVETDWHAAFRLPIERRIKNSSHAVEAKTRWVYNARGQPTARCDVDVSIGGADSYICGSALNGPGGVRQWSYTYCEDSDVTAGICPLVGLLKTSNGARLTTDAGMGGSDDLTAYAYYQTDDSTCAVGGVCSYRRGDLQTITNGLGQVTTYVSYDKNGRVTRTTDGNGTATDFQYHPRGWLTDRIVRANSTGADADDATTHIDYDLTGNVTKVTQPDGAYLSYTYDDAHRLIKITDNLGDTIDYCPGGIGSADCLDNAGNRRIEQIKDPSLSIKRSLHRVYDQLGRLQKVLNAANQPTFDATNGYDGNGNLVLSTDGLGYKTQQSYDGLNRLVKTLQNYNGTDPATSNTETDYAYDTRDNLRQVKDPDLLNTVYGYDGLNNLTSLSSPDTGSGMYTPDSAGNRASQTDARGITSTYIYDALNRLIAVTYPTTSLNVTYAYDQSNAATGCATSFPIGRLTTMTDGSGSTTYCYDRRGNVLKKTQVTGSATLVTQYTYTKADRIATITYPSGNLVTYGRDALGRVSSASVTIGTTTTTLVSNATYYPFGPLNVLTFGNGRTLTKTYDQDYAIDQIAASVAGGLSLNFGVDVMGDITDVNASTRTYSYDPLYRLTGALVNGTTPAEQYTYGKTGDRLSAALNGGTATTYTYATGTHHLASVGGVSRSYDSNGNTQTGIGGLTFSYDDKNRLATVAGTSLSASYVTNGRGERVRKDVTVGSTVTTTYSYDEGGALLGEYSAAGAAQAEYVYLDRVPIGVVIGPTVSYVEADHLGTPRQVIDPTINVAIWSWDFFASTFGNSAPNQDPDGDTNAFILNLRFAGQYNDVETGIDYNYFRDYEPGAGRYVESDPIGLSGGINTYLYVYANSLRFTDPRGQNVSICCRYVDSIVGTWIFGRQRHCYFIVDGMTYGLYPVDGPFGTSIGLPSPGDGRDKGGDCKECKKNCSDPASCVRQANQNYPIGEYHYLGPNSNTFVGSIAKSCCDGGMPTGLGNHPGSDSPPPEFGFNK